MKDFTIELIWTKIQIAFAAIGGWLGYFLGGFDGILYALIALMVLDYVTGVMCAIEAKKLSSAVGFKGICRKVLILILVGIAHITDVHVVSNGSALRTAVVFWYISNEALSIFENSARLGLPVPEKLKQALKQLHGKDDADE